MNDWRRAIEVCVAIGVWILGVVGGTHAGETWDDINGKDAASVLGQEDFDGNLANRGGAGSTANTLNAPENVAVDAATGKVFVSDTGNNRVLRYASAEALLDGSDAEAVLGQADFDDMDPVIPTTRSGFRSPSGIVVDGNGRLWVCDTSNHRILRFDNASTKANGANADGVLGQANFLGFASATSQNGMNFPKDVAVDPATGNLYVADTQNNRVLRFNSAAGKANGANADVVLGQSVFNAGNVNRGGAIAPNSLFQPFAVAVGMDGRLWVADKSNNRVLRFENAAGKADGDNADGVLGQGGFLTGAKDRGGTAAANSMDDPIGLAANSTTGQLWVSDIGNHRVLRFDGAAGKGDGANADGVLGQENLTDESPGTAPDRLNQPVGVAVSGDFRLWVADMGNHRALRFQANHFQPDGRIGTKAGNQKGNGKYNGSGAGQTAKVTAKGNRAGKAFFTIENDGDVPDNYTIKGTKGNSKLRVKYFRTPGGNVTGAMTKGGLAMNGLASGGAVKFKAKIKGTAKSKGKRAGRTLTVRSTSQTDGETDVIKAKVKKTP